MNIELLKKVRDAIADEDNPVGFDMDRWGKLNDPCGTTCCVAGHAVMIGGRNRWKWTASYVGVVMAARKQYDEWWLGDIGSGLDDEDGIGHLAAELLDLSADDAAYLFGGGWSSLRLEYITRADAASYLDRCIKAGEIIR